jgi:hypothetical protein
LDAVPEVLASAFAKLVSATFDATPESETWSRLASEVRLLERGAAAMKVQPLEQLCTALLGMYEAFAGAEAMLPLPLVRRAHAALIDMLDRSAAWQQVEPVPELVAALTACQREAEGCREPDPGQNAVALTAECLRQDVLEFIGTLSAALDRPVRLQLESSGVLLDPMSAAAVMSALKPLVRYLLLDPGVDARSRRQLHKPRVSTLAITLRGPEPLVVMVGEDSREELVAPAELERLRKRLPDAAGALVCEARAGIGRCFTFTLAQTS